MTPADRELATAREMIRSMEAQLIALYEEQDRTAGHDALEAMVASLNAQVCALLDEKADLERELAVLRAAAAPATAGV